MGDRGGDGAQARHAATDSRRPPSPQALASPGRIAVAAIAVAATVGVVVATTRYGIGLTPDSVAYLEGARSLADGRGYTSIGGGAILSWPPGYSAILSVAERLGIDALDAARHLSVVGIVATVALTYTLLRRHVRSIGVRVAATLVVGCSAVLLEIYSKALSEHLFIPLLLVFVIVCEEIMAHPRSRRLLAAAVVLAWAAFYLRYAGIVTVAVGALVILAAHWRRGVASALVRASVFGVAAVSVPVLWMARNIDVSGDPMGPRFEAAASPVSNVYRIVNEVSQWVATQLAGPPVRAVTLGLVAILLAAIVWAVASGRASLPSDASDMLPLVVLVGVYVVYLAVAASFVAFGAINTRFMLPVFVPVVVLAAWLFERVRDQLPSWRTALTVVGITWVALNVAWFAGRSVGYARDGAGGYATARWHDSEILRDAAHLDFSVRTYSNDARAVSVFLDEPVRRSPARTYFASDEETGDLDAFARRVACGGPVQLIWFVPHGAKNLHTLDDIEAVVRLEVIAERPDGAIYEVLPRADTTVDC